VSECTITYTSGYTVYDGVTRIDSSAVRIFEIPNRIE